MLFNSYIYILVFLPVSLVIYFFLNRIKNSLVANYFLVAASFFFYSYWDPKYLLLMLISVIFNYSIGTLLSKMNSKKAAKTALFTGIAINLVALGYYKYADFFIKSTNAVAGTNFDLQHIILPLAISFFTFQQIAYLVDSYRGLTKEYDFLNYCLFVSFFPQLIAGPIVHHKEMMTQFEQTENKKFIHENFHKGLFIFSMGLFKKTVIADTFALWANFGYNNDISLTLFNAWATSLAYTFQLYFDFSGYSDMAVGAAKMFNIDLPVNFNSPYKAVNIQDFWKRWHMTLSRWLKDYLYIPLGGSKGSSKRTSFNLMTTFLLGGLWHGASWTFVAWGLLHGIGSVIHRFWHKTGIKMSRTMGIFITFLFVHIAWVFFRAESFGKAFYLIKGLFGFNGISMHESLQYSYPFLSTLGIQLTGGTEYYGSFWETSFILAVAGWIVFRKKNSQEIAEHFESTYLYIVLTSILLAFGIFATGSVNEFLYFNF